MYKEYFGLEELPFSIAPDPRYLYMSEQHREALAHLVYGISSDGGFVLLTGEVGTGKTTVCRCLLEQIPENTEIAFVLNPKLTVEELLATICDEFGVSYPEGNTSIKVFVDLINLFLLDALSKGRKTVLIIDEAQNLSADVLEQLRLLTNLETNQRKLLQIILLGQPELREMLSRPELRQLAQRVIARYHLGPLSKKDTSAYITHRLSIAGLRDTLFPASTVNRIFRLSAGVPRLINVLCDRALLGAFTQGHSRVNKTTLLKAGREALGTEDDKEPRSRVLRWLMTGSLIAVIAAVLAITYYNYGSQLGAVGIIDPPQPETLKSPADTKDLQGLWPGDRTGHMGMETAFQSLFELWGISYAPGDSTPCRQALAHGLRCLSKRDSLNSLALLNRPAVLKMFDKKGQEFYAVLTALDKETATFVSGRETRKIAVRDIATHWFGDYTVLWKVPPDYTEEILPGSRGAQVQWLDKQLALIQNRAPGDQTDPVFDNAIVDQVKKFQLAEGLVPDGIVGTYTLIHLNSAVGGSIPKLISKEDI